MPFEQHKVFREQQFCVTGRRRNKILGIGFFCDFVVLSVKCAHAQECGIGRRKERKREGGGPFHSFFLVARAARY